MEPTAFQDPPADGFQTLDIMPQNHLDGSSVVIQRVRGSYIPEGTVQLKFGVRYRGYGGKTYWAGGFSILLTQLQEHVNRVRKVWSKYQKRTDRGVTYEIPPPAKGDWELLDSMDLEHLAASNGRLEIGRNGDPSRIAADVLQLQFSMKYDGNERGKGFSIQHPQIDDYLRRMEQVLVLYGVAPADGAGGA